jgi:hypothetical protein
MTCVKQSVASGRWDDVPIGILALALTTLAAACSFRSPGASGTDPDAPVAIDAAIDAPTGMPIAWLHPWSHRKEITLLASQIEAPGNGSLSNFPVLISITDPQIGASALSTGEDIVFTTSDATTVIPGEIESFAGNQLVAWVKVPSLSATTDTKLYVYYAHSGISSLPPQTPQAVWATDYLGVWHLQQDPGPGGAGEIKDATSGNHHGTADASMDSTDLVAGRIVSGFNFDGSNNFLNYGSMNLGNAFTISMWVDLDSGSNIKTLISNSNSGPDTDGFRIFINGVNNQDRRITLETASGGIGSARYASTNTGAISFNTMTHVAVTVDRATTTARIYLNGISAGTSTSIASNFQSNSDFEIGRMENNLFHFDGTLDEIQISSTPRAAEWLRTSYNNQSQPDNFHTLASEENEPAL